jgi:hypothetical protein
MSFPPPAETQSPTARIVDGSADLVGDAFTRIRAPYGGKRRYLVEKLCDIRTRAWRFGHRARPAQEHHEVEVGGAELIAEEQGTVGLEMIFDEGMYWRALLRRA